MHIKVKEINRILCTRLAFLPQYQLEKPSHPAQPQTATAGNQSSVDSFTCQNQVN
jgi:hypothetical protein